MANGWAVPKKAKRRFEELCTQAAPWWPPTHPHSGWDKERAQVGDPGHCEYCAVLGHVVAHPDAGCGDVGCLSDHLGTL